MDIVSLYDKYHSQHNRTYMYNLLAGLVKDTYSVDISKNNAYNQFFETNFENTFKVVNTNDLKDLNKHLIDTQMDYYQNFVSKHTVVEPVPTNDTVGHYIIHSLERIINFQNSHRHTYKVQHTCKDIPCQLEKVVIPIEDNYLFANPLLIISLNNHHHQVHLRGLLKLGEREYGIYSPFYESTFTLKTDKVTVSVNNQLSTDRSACDVYKIDSYEDGQIHTTFTKDEFKVGDYIRLCNFGNVDLADTSILQTQCKVLEVKDNKLIVDKSISIVPGLYIMNISLQNTVHISTG